MNRLRKRALIQSALTLSISIAAFVHAGPDVPRARADGRYTTSSRRVAPGATLIRITDRRGPKRIRALRVNPLTELTIDVALANGEIPGHERPSSMAARHGAIAAINGDFAIRPSQVGAGRPVGIFAEDADLKTSSLIWGRNFAISQDERSMFLGHTGLYAWITQHDSGKSWKIKAWNALSPDPEQLSAYTPAGSYAVRPPRNSCGARLYPVGPTTWSEGRGGLQAHYVVDRVRCGSKGLARRDGIVISAPAGTRRAEGVRRHLRSGETVTLGWSMGWRGIVETVGGNPDLLQDGTVTVEPCSVSFCRRHPRTGIGVTSRGKLLLVTVDGRQPGYSVGMTLTEFARLFQRLGARWALNLDGGGSTAMVVKGRLVNRPSDGGERAVGSAVLVLPGADTTEPVPGSEPGAFPGATNAACLALADAASTGGMLDAVARGALANRSSRLPGALRQAVEVFRGQRRCLPATGHGGTELP